MIKRARTQKRRQTVSLNYRTNHRIRVPEVMLIDQHGNNRGVVQTREARSIAEEASLDLVEVAPNARPPVCRIMDYSKFQYDQQKKAREQRKKQTKVEIKTVKMKIKTDDFHMGLGISKAQGWLEEGKKVKFSVRFYGRERDYPELGRGKMNHVATTLSEVSSIEQHPMMEGWTMTMMLAPLETALLNAKPAEEEAAPEVKNVRIKLNTDGEKLEKELDLARIWLQKGNIVNISIRKIGQAIDKSRAKLADVANMLTDDGVPQGEPVKEGPSMSIQVFPLGMDESDELDLEEMEEAASAVVASE